MSDKLTKSDAVNLNIVEMVETGTVLIAISPFNVPPLLILTHITPWRSMITQRKARRSGVNYRSCQFYSTKAQFARMAALLAGHFGW